MPEQNRPPIAFLSRRFVANDVVDAICDMLGPEIDCQPAEDLILRPLPPEILSRIRNADLLIAIITLDGNSSWIQNELGMAYGLAKPILVFYEEGVPTDGFAPMVSEYVEFKKNALAELIRDKPRLVKGIAAVVEKQRSQEQEAIHIAEQQQLGVIGVFRNRLEAFTSFRSQWDKEPKRIDIVASTMEGFRNFSGDAGHELLERRLESGCTVQLLLTDPEFLHFRAENENVRVQSIQDDLVETEHQLRQLRKAYGEQISVKTFRSPPTCFLIATSSHMLLNPYPYMRTAYSSFGLIVRQTKRKDDIFHVYHEYHFKRAWKEAKNIVLENTEQTN